MQPLQYELRRSAAKDNRTTHAAAAPQKISSAQRWHWGPFPSEAEHEPHPLHRQGSPHRRRDALIAKKTQGLVRFLTFKHRVDEAIPGAGDVVVVLCGDVMMWWCDVVWWYGGVVMWWCDDGGDVVTWLCDDGGDVGDWFSSLPYFPYCVV